MEFIKCFVGLESSGFRGLLVKTNVARVDCIGFVIQEVSYLNGGAGVRLDVLLHVAIKVQIIIVSNFCFFLFFLASVHDVTYGVVIVAPFLRLQVFVLNVHKSLEH